MRFSVEHRTETETFPARHPAPGPAPDAPPAPATDPTAPNLAYLRDAPAALQSFFATAERIVADNPVAAPRLLELAGKARSGQLNQEETQELQQLKGQALRHGRAIGAVIGFFLKLKPYPMLEEIRKRGKIYQPLFGPVLVVDGDAVRDVLERDQDFTVEPYGIEMMKVMSPSHNGGFNTFILSTDENAVYEPDKRLLSAVCSRQDAAMITDVIHEDCRRRLGEAVAAARASGTSTIDVVQAVARYVPVALGHRYLGVPVAATPGTFELTPEMLAYYGAPIDGQPETALTKADGVIPDEAQMYGWIKAAFQHFFNNVQKDPAVSVKGLRACRQLLAYLLREIDIQRRRIQQGLPVDDTMLTRLVRFQLGQSAPGASRPADLDPRLVSDLRIAENVMGTIVGAVAGQEEATCRAIDAVIRLQEGQDPNLGTGHAPVWQLRRGPAAGAGDPRRPRRRGQSRRALPLRDGGAPHRAARRGPAPQVRQGRGNHRRQPAAVGGHAGLCRARLGHEGRSRTRRVQARLAARALAVVRVEPPYVPGPARLAGHHHRVDGRRAGPAGSSGGPSRARASRRSRSSGVSAASSSTTRISTQ